MWKHKRLSRGQAALTIVAVVIIANMTTCWVLSRNLKSGIYPTDADAIMIPIAFTFMNSLFILLPGVAGALMPHHGIGWRIASRVLLSIAGLFALALAIYWWYPDHYLAGVAFIPVVLACLGAFWKRPTTTKAEHAE